MDAPDVKRKNRVESRPVTNRPPIEALEKTLLRSMGTAVSEWELIQGGDRILVGVSGGKDSYTLLHLLRRLRERAPVRFDLIAVNLDQGHPGFPSETLRGYLESIGVEHRMIKQDTYSVVKRLTPDGKSFCPVCSRLRRGILYNTAVELGCNKIALGHHRDDLIETVLMSAIYAGRMRTMPPKLRSDDGRNTVIRPLCYTPEEDIAAFANAMQFPVIPCDLCGSQENLRRKRIKRLIAELASEHPQVRGNLLHALQSVVPEHLLDRGLLSRLSESRGRDPWVVVEDACSPNTPENQVVGLTKRVKAGSL
jgi:tRNA 2-thiocytidine biosynthesis protein TtcA